MNDSSKRGPDSTPDPTSVSPDLTHPPRPPLRLRIGVVGHRPDTKKRAAPDVKALREICRTLLLHIRNTHAGVAKTHAEIFADTPLSAGREPRGLRLISSLAEGADQWVASEAEQLGYEIQAVLPFERADYRQDFTDPAVVNDYDHLLDLATAVFELDGCRARAGESYLAAGRVLLNQTDILIALWDGRNEQGAGGTAQIVREALSRRIPTIWVNWNAPAEWWLRRPASRLLEQHHDVPGDLAILADQVTELLLPPATGASPKG
ncbi:MAG TPA: hypothetical protein VFV34_25935, partial [Blastocatellia bacterium]|nr:hypothetical protein [Blastocatellia bacterium]